MPTMEEEGFGEKYGVFAAIAAFLCCFFEAGLQSSPPPFDPFADPPGRSLFLPFSVMIVCDGLLRSFMLCGLVEGRSFSWRGLERVSARLPLR